MKGIVDIEFILSVVVFLTTVTFVTFLIISNIPLFHMEAANEDLRARAYEISELLLFDEGYPIGWEESASNVERIGLSGGTRYNISSKKIEKMNSTCAGQAGYENVKSLLGQDYSNDVTIKIIGANNNDLLTCKPAIMSTVRPSFEITRFAVLENKTIIKMTIGVI